VLECVVDVVLVILTGITGAVDGNHDLGGGGNGGIFGGDLLVGRLKVWQ